MDARNCSITSILHVTCCRKLRRRTPEKCVTTCYYSPLPGDARGAPVFRARISAKQTAQIASTCASRSAISFHSLPCSMRTALHWSHQASLHGAAAHFSGREPVNALHSYTHSRS